MSKKSKSSWIEKEFSQAELGDQRRELRLLSIVSALADNFSASLPEAMKDNASLQGAYRFFKNEKFESEDLLNPHVLSTVQRAKESESSVLLAIQDTSELDYSSQQNKKTDLGKKGYAYGYITHNTLLSTSSGTPLGLLQQLVWTRPKKTEKRNRSEIAKKTIEKKESYKWLESLQWLNELSLMIPEATWVSVGDREADLFNLFAEERSCNVELLVRSKTNRNLIGTEKKLLQSLDEEELAGELSFFLPRRGNEKARKVESAIRFKKVTFPVPKRLKYQNYSRSQELTAIQVKEKHPPKGKKGLHWTLLTTIEVKTVQKAIEVINWYKKRWLVELFHKALKSGCKVEELQLNTVEETKRALPLYSVIAWRMLYLTMFSRHSPELEVSAVFSEDEWKALYCITHYTQQAPDSPPKLKDAILWLAKMGGYLNRKSDPPPGMIVLWRGFRQLSSMVKMYQVMKM